jgi:hypothetical protein
MSYTEIAARQLIHDLDITFPDGETVVLKHDSRKVSPVDMYDLRLVADTDVKKISLSDLYVLIAYGEEYTRDYIECNLKFNMFKKRRSGLPMANFDGAHDEWVAFNEIQNSLRVLKAEVRHRS